MAVKDDFILELDLVDIKGWDGWMDGWDIFFETICRYLIDPGIIYQCILGKIQEICSSTFTDSRPAPPMPNPIHFPEVVLADINSKLLPEFPLDPTKLK